jgi:DNA-binding PadR family transcriptional regulator
MRSEYLKRAILEMLTNGNEELHGYSVHRKLLSQDIHVQLSRLYKVLHDMLSEGLLEDRWNRSRSGPKKRVYVISKIGQNKLDNILLDG